MNKQRKNTISNCIAQLNYLTQSIERIKEEEEEAKDNLADYPQFEVKVMDMEQAIEAMERAVETIKEGINELEDSINI